MFKKFSLFAACVGVLLLTFLAVGQVRDKKTTLTFSQPVELPGIVLPAGTYVFKLANLQQSRNFVHVYDAGETRLLTTIMGIPHDHAVVHDKTYIGFAERPSGSPEAIHEWFYPGDAKGLEFVYPKARAQNLAREAHEPVLAAEMTPAQPEAELAQVAVVEITPENQEVAVGKTADLPARSRVPEVPVQTASLKPELPGTGSSVPLIALVGMLCLLVAGVLKGVAAKLR
jgi:hypothetical protein